MEPVVQVTVARLGLDASSNSYVVILQELAGDRMLPIWIGHAEAFAILDHMNGVRHERPMTHDLCKSLIIGLGASLQHVVVTRAEGRTYFGELHLVRGSERYQIDARPSDCLAIALRMEAPVFASEVLLLEPPDETEDAGEDPGPDPLEPPPQDLDAESLKRYLESLRPEDFGKFNP